MTTGKNREQLEREYGIMKKRLDVHVDEERYDYIKEMSEKSGIPMNVITDELLAIGIAVKRGEVIEQQSLPIIREIVSSELRRTTAQLREAIREDMQLEFTDEFKALTRQSDNRLAAIMMRIARDSNIARRLVYSVLAKAHGPDFALLAYEDAREKAGKELANRPSREKARDEA
jgi:hypothetical protein